MTTTMIREVTLQYSNKPIKASISSPEKVAEILRKIAPDNVREHFLAIYLDGSHTPISYYVVSTGLANSSQVHPREVFQPAILSGACAVIVAHNHPSGNLERSTEDDNVTKQLRDAGKLLGIKLLDHVVFTDDAHYSYRTSSAIFE